MAPVVHSRYALVFREADWRLMEKTPLGGGLALARSCDQLGIVALDIPVPTETVRDSW